MRQSLPWGRLIAEMVVVVVSILLAFGVDAAWDDYQLREEEREVLRGLEQELDEAKLVMQTSREQTMQARERVRSFLSSTPSEVAAIPEADAGIEIYPPLTRQWVGRIPRAALDAATGSGQMSIISDPQLRASLARLLSRHESLEGMVDLISDLDARTATLLGEWDGVYYAQSDDLLESSSTVVAMDAEVLAAYRADPRVRGAASAKLQFTRAYLLQLQGLEDAMNETLGLLGEQLDSG